MSKVSVFGIIYKTVNRINAKRFNTEKEAFEFLLETKYKGLFYVS